MPIPSPKKGLILIVEDEPSQMELLSFNLNAEGYDVLKAEDGEEGLLLFKENDIDCILISLEECLNEVKMFTS